MTTQDQPGARGYVHGFTQKERERLYRQARFVEHRVHAGLSFGRARRMLEVGCGVGAQTEVLLRRYPELFVTGLDASQDNLAAAEDFLASRPGESGRYRLVLGDASSMDLAAGEHDAAFLCWILEHVEDPARVLSEVRRVCAPGAPVVVTEVQNGSFFLAPYSPCTLAYWTAFNDHQFELGGDPFVGARLGNLLLRVGFRDIVTEVRTVLLDNRSPSERAEFIEFWTELLLSGAPGLLAADRVSVETVEGMKGELARVARDPDAVFYYSFVQATARVT